MMPSVDFTLDAIPLGQFSAVGRSFLQTIRSRGPFTSFDDLHQEILDACGIIDWGERTLHRSAAGPSFLDYRNACLAAHAARANDEAVAQQLFYEHVREGNAAGSVAITRRAQADFDKAMRSAHLKYHHATAKAYAIALWQRAEAVERHRGLDRKRALEAAE